MSAVSEGFDAAFERWKEDLYRLAFVLVGRPQAAKTLSFEALLRLGATEDVHAADEAAKRALFAACCRLGDDYFLRKPHKMPTAKELNAFALPFPVTDGLIALLRLPYARRCGLALSFLGFSGDAIRELAGSAAARAAQKSPPAGSREAFFAIALPEEELLALSDAVYDRFAERSVGLENRLHAMHAGFERAAPWLTLGVIAFCAICVWVSMKG